MNRIVMFLLCATSLACFVVACKKPAGTTTGSGTSDHSHDGHTHDGGHDHSHEEAGHDHAHDDGHDHADAQDDHGDMVELGSATIGGWTVRASRDAGALAPGGEAAIDAWVTGGTAGSKINAVRFWIGDASAEGSVKAKAEIEDPADPTHYHTHVELPQALAEGTKLWIEIEDDEGAKSSGSVDLKP